MGLFFVEVPEFLYFQLHFLSFLKKHLFSLGQLPLQKLIGLIFLFHCIFPVIVKHVDILLEYLVFLAFLFILVSCYNKLLFEVGYGLLVLIFLLIRFGEELFVLDLQLFIGLLVWVLETVLLYSGLEFCNGRLLLIYLLLLGLHLVHVLLDLLPLLLELDEAVLLHVVLAEVEVGWEGGGLGGVGVGDGADEQIFFLSKHHIISSKLWLLIFLNNLVLHQSFDLV